MTFSIEESINNTNEDPFGNLHTVTGIITNQEEQLKKVPSQNRFQVRRARVTINENANEEMPKTHHTVTGIGFHPATILRRTNTNHRFQVDRAISDDYLPVRNSTPGALGEPVQPTPRKFERSFYWFAMHRKKFGFRYIALCLLVILYTLFGATVFYIIEGNNEKATLKVSAKNLDVLLERQATQLSKAVNDPLKHITQVAMKDYLKKAYIDLQKQESQYKWSTYYRLEDPDKNLKWTFSSACFFSMNVYTTTGYGAIAAETFAGQLFTIIYAFCFVPMTLVVLRDLGQMFLVNFTKLYAHVLTFVRKCRGHNEIDEDEVIQLPIKYCMCILIGYLLFCTTFIYLYDHNMGPNAGMPYFTAFYFSFISLTTIGLGDVMPNNVPFTPAISTIFFIGMTVIKVVNRATYIAVENGVFGIMTIAEGKIDKLFKRHDKVTCVESGDDSSEEENFVNKRRNELVNNFTVRSIATLMRSNHDIYGGGFGRVALKRSDLMHRSDLTLPSSNDNNVNNSRRVRSISSTVSDWI